MTLKDGRRGGVLTQASVLTVTSNPTRTSPVKRGKWILEKHPRHAAAAAAARRAAAQGGREERSTGVAAAADGAAPGQPGLRRLPPAHGPARLRLRELRRHRRLARPATASTPIDPSGVLPGGESFKGPAELKAILKGREQDFARCLAEKMLTYALGRGLERYDRCAVDEIVRRRRAEQVYGSRAWCSAIVEERPVPEATRKARGVDEQALADLAADAS